MKFGEANMENKRFSNYDLLRFSAMIGVIINHVSDKFVLSDNPHRIFAYVCEGIGAFAVPAFLMLTGAFAISNYSNVDFEKFYKKSFNKLGIHILVFSIIYFGDMCIRQLQSGHTFIESLYYPAQYLFKGWSGHPLWYSYNLIGIYFCIPFLAALHEKYHDKNGYHTISFLYCIWAFLSYFLFDSSFTWSVSRVFCFLGFVILGNEIRYFFEGKGNNVVAALLITVGFLSYILEFVILYNHVERGGEYFAKSIHSHMAPLSLLGIVMIFGGVTMLKISFTFPLTIKYSFFIYLTHKYVLDRIDDVLNQLKIEMSNDCRTYIPIITLLTFAISLFVSIIYVKLSKLIKNSRKLLSQ